MNPIESVVSRIPEWHGKEVEIHELSGGLTNHNYRVVVGGNSYVVRIPGTGSELLAIDRNNEYQNSLTASRTGVGPQVIHYLEDESVMVLEFIEGTTMSNAALQSPDAIRRVAASLRKLHGGPRFVNTFNMFRVMDGYRRIVKERDVRVPAGYPTEAPPAAEKIEIAVNVHPLPLFPCHNDLLAENLIDDGVMMRIIDYELAGNDDPCFELARMHLFSMMSDLGWTLWGAIQNQVSSVDFDFWDYTNDRWNRVREKIHSHRFLQWLKTASRA
jgi:thiamine kinase-like enzyme